jgi:hypothetical protein
MMPTFAKVLAAAECECRNRTTRRSPPWCAKQRLTLCIEAALSGYESGIVDAGIIKRTVPAASLTPFAPGDVVAILAVGISCVPGCAEEALTRMRGAGNDGPADRGSCERGKKNGGSAEKSKFCHCVPPWVSKHENHRAPAKFLSLTLKDI